jgi:hypothetical protein
LGGARDDVRLRSREGVQMRLEHLDGLRGIAEGFPPREPSAVGRFVEAVRALSDNPRPESVERYLVASRALEDSRSRGKAAPSRAA